MHNLGLNYFICLLSVVALLQSWKIWKLVELSFLRQGKSWNLRMEFFSHGISTMENDIIVQFESISFSISENVFEIF